MSDLVGDVSEPMCKERMKALDTRLHNVENNVQEIRSLALSVERLTITVENMVKEQTLQNERLDDLESKDGDMWRSFVKYAITAIVSLIIGYAMKNLGF